jgi:predicted N-formylglutamate amidohydrolase
MELTRGPVLDLHMMRPRAFDVGLGLGPHPAMVAALVEPLTEELRRAGVRVALNEPFRAAGVTLTAQLQRLGVAAVQLELSYNCFDRSSPLMRRAWTGLAAGVRRVAEGSTLRSSGT